MISEDFTQVKPASLNRHALDVLEAAGLRDLVALELLLEEIGVC